MQSVVKKHYRNEVIIMRTFMRERRKCVHFKGYILCVVCCYWQSVNKTFKNDLIWKKKE